MLGKVFPVGSARRFGHQPASRIDEGLAGPAVPTGGVAHGFLHHRAGTRNIFLTCEPLAGWRHVAITERRTMEDFAHQMRWLVDEAYPDAPVVRAVLHNLNTHRMASRYETFPATAARPIVRRPEFHYTPKHAS